MTCVYVAHASLTSVLLLIHGVELTPAGGRWHASLALRDQHIDLPQLGNNLFRLESPPRHVTAARNKGIAGRDSYLDAHVAH
jgi:hypothetical protein